MPCLYVTDEAVEDMMAVLRMAGVYTDISEYHLRQEVRHKLEEGKVPCFEQMKWVKREKRNELV